MNPKEKAESLINKYNLVVLDAALGGSNTRVKKCALITVNEVLNYSKAHGYIGLTEFWEEVKQLLESRY